MGANNTRGESKVQSKVIHIFGEVIRKLLRYSHEQPDGCGASRGLSGAANRAFRDRVFYPSLLGIVRQSASCLRLKLIFTTFAPERLDRAADSRSHPKCCWSVRVATFLA